MTVEYMVALATVILSWALGYLAKRSAWLSDNLIPVQNILIGCIIAAVEWIVTGDFSVAIALSGLIAGGSYDIVHNLQKMKMEP